MNRRNFFANVLEGSLSGAASCGLGFTVASVKPRARPWAGMVARAESSAWDDYHDWKAWMEWKFVGRADVQAILDDADSTTAVCLYCAMCDLTGS